MTAIEGGGQREIARARSMYCSPENRASIGRRAREAGMSFSRFMVACALHGADADDGEEDPRLVLSEDEQRQLYERVALLNRCNEALLSRLPGRAEGRARDQGVPAQPRRGHGAGGADIPELRRGHRAGDDGEPLTARAGHRQHRLRDGRRRRDQARHPGRESLPMRSGPAKRGNARHRRHLRCAATSLPRIRVSHESGLTLPPHSSILLLTATQLFAVFHPIIGDEGRLRAICWMNPALVYVLGGSHRSCCRLR